MPIARWRREGADRHRRAPEFDQRVTRIDLTKRGHDAGAAQDLRPLRRLGELPLLLGGADVAAPGRPRRKRRVLELVIPQSFGPRLPILEGTPLRSWICHLPRRAAVVACLDIGPDEQRVLQLLVPGVLL